MLQQPTASFEAKRAKTGAINPPNTANMLRFISSTWPKDPSTIPKLLKNHISTLAARITVPARFIKDQLRSKVVLNTFLADGIWYAGSSIMKGEGSPAKDLVFLRIIPETKTDATPIKYAVGATHHAPPNNAPAIKPTIGILAPQGIKDVVIIVILRSLSFSIVREAIIPGTEQPDPISMEI